MASFVLSFFPLDVLDEIWDLTESVSEGFLTYSYISGQLKMSHARLTYLLVFIFQLSPLINIVLHFRPVSQLPFEICRITQQVSGEYLLQE